LVFFHTQKELDTFFESAAFLRYKEEALKITEALSIDEKDNYVTRATLAGTVSLLTRSLGRGTDFYVSDPQVKAKGGIAVIQTFLSEEQSEETQIKGRTARQGDKGSYKLVLLALDLEKFLITPNDIAEMRQKSVYWTFLNEKRNTWFVEQYNTNKKALGILINAHKLAVQFSNALLSGDLNFLRGYLEERNKGDNIGHSKTLVLMDATGSMGHLLQKAKATITEMFQRAKQVLNNQGIQEGFELQFAVYRNYNSRENEILECSTWESSPQNLTSFMNRIDTAGGWGREAIEIGLWHANQEVEKLDSEDKLEIVLIGDAAANTDKEVSTKRASFSESYWGTTKFKVSTTWNTEIAKLKQKGIPVHTFYVSKDPTTIANFKGIQQAGGPNARHEFLDVNTGVGAEMLTAFITTTILANVGGAERGAALVQKYQELYPVTRV